MDEIRNDFKFKIKLELESFFVPFKRFNYVIHLADKNVGLLTREKVRYVILKSFESELKKTKQKFKSLQKFVPKDSIS